jgi:cyanophycinase
MDIVRFAVLQCFLLYSAAQTSSGDGYLVWCTGTCDGSDASPPTAAGAVLMGGGTDVDEAFAWHIGNANGGDFLILRASGADGYNVKYFET